MASVVTTDISGCHTNYWKNHEKNIQKKNYFRPTDPNFFAIWNRNHKYFFSRLMNIPHFGIYSVYEHAHELMFKYEAYRMLPKYQNFNTTFRGVLSIVTRGSSFSAGCCMTSVFVNLIVRPVHKINQNCATLPKDFNSYTYKSYILHTCLFSFHNSKFPSHFLLFWILVGLKEVQFTLVCRSVASFQYKRVGKGLVKPLGLPGWICRRRRRRLRRFGVRLNMTGSSSKAYSLNCMN